MSRPGVVAIVLQVRLGSKRLPGKALRELGRVSVLEHCVTRLKRSAIGPVVVATTTLPEDDQIAASANRLGAHLFRGARDDVLRRMVEAAASVDAAVVVRATGDNPAVDVDAARRTVSVLETFDAEYVVEEGLPYGAAVEAVTSEALERSDRMAADPRDREHVTTLIKRPAAGFRTLRPAAPRALYRPDLRFTVDTLDDLLYMRTVFGRAGAGRNVVSLRQMIAAADAVRDSARTEPLAGKAYQV